MVSPKANSAACLPQYIILMLITYAFEMASCITAATQRDFVSIFSSCILATVLGNIAVLGHAVVLFSVVNGLCGGTG